jgi:hypothetical protein
MQTMAPPEDALIERFARLDERFNRTDERIADVDRRVAEAAKDTHRRFDEVDHKFVEVDHRFVEVNRRITETSAATNKRLENVESEMGLLRHQMSALNVTFNRGSFAIVASVLGVIAAILAKGG